MLTCMHAVTWRSLCVIGRVAGLTPTTRVGVSVVLKLTQGGNLAITDFLVLNRKWADRVSVCITENNSFTNVVNL